ncbi:MAG: hypothetical protein JSS49_17725 [Planctomycetes bacterium]|nr:hypothetical protein [Planctomycetota bacterium]
MFSEPTINSVSNLFSAPGIGLELVGASALAFGVVCYLGRVAWIALSHARRMELAAMQSIVVSPQEVEYKGPYCAG